MTDKKTQETRQFFSKVMLFEVCKVVPILGSNVCQQYAIAYDDTLTLT